ncbi:MAG: hypothetical protein ACK4KW_14115 [Gemmobacter sp.]
MQHEARPVRRRRVFYIPGYDPFPPRRYRELYRREGAAQAAISGHELRLRRRGESRFGWTVDARVEGAAVRSDFDVLIWSDIVRASMAQGIGATYWQLARTATVYLGTGALWRMMRLCKGPVIAGLYPYAVLLAQLAVAGVAAWAVAALVALWLPAWVALVPAAAAGWAVLWGFRRLDGRLMAWYLMHDLAFSAAHAGAYSPALETRLSEFRAEIEGALSDPGLDEVLVVGHSSGAQLAISVLADLIRGGTPGHGPALALLTLGQAVPMMSFLPAADRLRADLRLLSASLALTWVDVSAPGDGCCFALCDPVAVSGVAPPDKRWPLVISAAFSQSLSPERWRRMKRRFFRLHFQYLCAFDRPEGFDYFAITAGPQTLAARFAGRTPSRSRIETPVSGHVSTARAA